ncbi:pesticin C-terminus-like muramidase [uncultured Desulfovibrio sp.]|uniref:pesticin C-terminus-like muramidase n=1 Tax=uncultured Desulfovibrio sp. TaxID=167968 RepID=UPI00261D7EB6|nr:pesticin C-terminus-like muramidase [uncultured Desulfovibrio sp.]
MAIAWDSIRHVLRLPGFEGPQQLRGYIPCNLSGGGTANYYGGDHPERYIPMGISGVTVGTGVDLGQTDAGTLAGMGLEGALLARLRPWLGRRQRDAVDALHAAPLVLDAAEADALDAAVLRHHVGRIARRYDQDAGAGAFGRLPWQAQAVIVSIQYQRGVNSPYKYPNTWAALVRRDWADAARRLKTGSFWTGYRQRRAREGALLEELC